MKISHLNEIRHRHEKISHWAMIRLELSKLAVRGLRPPRLHVLPVLRVLDLSRL